MVRQNSPDYAVVTHAIVLNRNGLLWSVHAAKKNELVRFLTLKVILPVLPCCYTPVATMRPSVQVFD